MIYFLVAAYSLFITLEAGVIASTCYNASVGEGETGLIQFVIRSDVDIHTDPNLLIFITKDSPGGNILMCGHENQGINCEVIDDRFHSEGLHGHELNVLIPNTSPSLQGRYDLYVVSEGAFDRPVSCYLFVTKKKVPEAGQNNFFSTVILVLSVAAGAVSVAVTIVFLCMLRYKRKRRKKSDITKEHKKDTEGEMQEQPSSDKILSYSEDLGSSKWRIAEGITRLASSAKTMVTGTARRVSQILLQSPTPEGGDMKLAATVPIVQPTGVTENISTQDDCAAQPTERDSLLSADQQQTSGKNEEEIETGEEASEQTGMDLSQADHQESTASAKTMVTGTARRVSQILLQSTTPEGSDMKLAAPVPTEQPTGVTDNISTQDDGAAQPTERDSLLSADQQQTSEKTKEDIETGEEATERSGIDSSQAVNPKGTGSQMTPTSYPTQPFSSRNPPRKNREHQQSSQSKETVV